MTGFYQNDNVTEAICRIENLARHDDLSNRIFADSDKAKGATIDLNMPQRIDNEAANYEQIVKNTNLHKESTDFYKDTVSWIGHVESINLEAEEFVGILKDLDNPGPEEMAEFDFNEVTQDDKELLKVGAVFYYSIGFSYSKGQCKKDTVLKFKRNVNFTEEEIDNNLTRIDNIVKNLRFE